jgi:hypothetical protein
MVVVYLEAAVNIIRSNSEVQTLRDQIYVNFSAWFMTNILFEKTKMKLRSKWHFVENKTDVMQHILKMQ